MIDLRKLNDLPWGGGFPLEDTKTYENSWEQKRLKFESSSKYNSILNIIKDNVNDRSNTTELLKLESILESLGTSASNLKARKISIEAGKSKEELEVIINDQLNVINEVFKKCWAQSASLHDKNVPVAQIALGMCYHAKNKIEATLPEFKRCNEYSHPGKFTLTFNADLNNSSEDKIELNEHELMLLKANCKRFDELIGSELEKNKLDPRVNITNSSKKEFSDLLKLLSNPNPFMVLIREADELFKLKELANYYGMDLIHEIITRVINFRVELILKKSPEEKISESEIAIISGVSNDPLFKDDERVKMLTSGRLAALGEGLFKHPLEFYKLNPESFFQYFNKCSNDWYKKQSDLFFNYLETGYFKNLQELRLKIENEADLLRIIKACPNLEILDIGIPHLTDEALVELAKLKKLKTLYLSGCSIETPSSFGDRLNDITSLQVLHLSQCKNITSHALAKLINLEELDLEFLDLNDKDLLAFVPKLRSLKKFSHEENKEMEGSFLSQIGDLSLELVNLSYHTPVQPTTSFEGITYKVVHTDHHRERRRTKITFTYNDEDMR
jgi:hypothetical protein